MVNMTPVYHKRYTLSLNCYTYRMSLYLKQQDTRSALQDKLNKELQEKAKQKALETERPDGVTDSAYIKDTKVTTSLAWVWALIALFSVGLIVWILIATAGQ